MRLCIPDKKDKDGSNQDKISKLEISLALFDEEMPTSASSKF